MMRGILIITGVPLRGLRETLRSLASDLVFGIQ
jgi:hypothetical protein